ncbi:Orf y [Tanacetum coccineum]
MFPDMVLSIDDFHNHVEVAIQTNGYDTWQGGESNLLVTMAMIGRLSNTSYMGFQYSMDNVVDHLTTTVITAIPGERRSVEELEGITRYSVDQHDREILGNDHLDKDEEHLIGICLQDPQTEHIPCDICFCEDCLNEDDDERSGGEILVIQEKLAQNQQDFLDEYLPQWDDHLANQKQELESKQENPFAAKRDSGVMLVLPADPGLWLEVISRWKSITINRLNNQMWSDNKAKLAFVENFLGENEPQNITSQVRQLILLEYPYRGSTDEQDRAYRDLDRITYEETKNLWSVLEDFRQLKIEESFKAKYPGLNSGVLPEIKFTYTFVSEMCKDAALAKELRDLSLCSVIPIPRYYKNNRKKYGIRKSRTYKGKPHNSHVKPFKIKYKDDRGRVKKCKCFICGKEGHFTKDYRTDFDDSSVYSISEGEESDESDSEQEGDDDQFSHHAFKFHPGPPTKIVEMVQSVGSWKPNKELPTQCKECEHDWKENMVTNYTICYYYRILTTNMSRLNYPKFQLTACALCAKNYLGKTVNVKGKQPQKPEEEKDFSRNEKEELWQSKESLLIRDLTDALRIIKQIKDEQIRLEEQKDEEIRQLKVQLQKEKAKQTQVQEEFLPLRSSQTARPCIETKVHYSGNATTSPKVRKITNQLYNVKVEFDIPSCPMFGTTAIIDTGASACCINKKVIPEEALEPLTQIVFFNGLNSRQQATHRIKQGSFLIEGNKFKIPLIYAFDMRDIRIKTSNQTQIAEIAELEVSEEEFLEINESIYFNQEGSKAFLEQFKPVINRLKHQGYIREEPLKHWKKNGELCKLDIINPDITIED